MTPNLNIQPDIKISLKQTFGIDSEMEVNAFSEKTEYVPEIDKNYKFDRDTTLAIISLPGRHRRHLPVPIADSSLQPAHGRRRRR